MTGRVFVLKVALQTDKSIWRRIAIRGNQTLQHLHLAIYDAFDREEEHLYSFYVPPPGSRNFRAALRDAVEYACPQSAEEFDPLAAFFGNEQLKNARKTRLASLGLGRRRKFYYLFDFGDEWWHEIIVEQTDAEPEEGEYPRILEKNNPSPPQYPDYDDEDEDEEDEDAGEEDDENEEDDGGEVEEAEA